jgi:hypothetical protein
MSCAGHGFVDGGDRDRPVVHQQGNKITAITQPIHVRVYMVRVYMTPPIPQRRKATHRPHSGSTVREGFRAVTAVTVTREAEGAMLAEVQSAPPPSRVWNDGCSDDGRRAMIGGPPTSGMLPRGGRPYVCACCPHTELPRWCTARRMERANAPQSAYRSTHPWLHLRSQQSRLVTSPTLVRISSGIGPPGIEVSQSGWTARALLRPRRHSRRARRQSRVPA